VRPPGGIEGGKAARTKAEGVVVLRSDLGKVVCLLVEGARDPEDPDIQGVSDHQILDLKDQG
jgi:hypothetical protein